MKVPDYHIKRGIVGSNEREVWEKDGYSIHACLFRDVYRQKEISDTQVYFWYMGYFLSKSVEERKETHISPTVRVCESLSYLS